MGWLTAHPTTVSVSYYPSISLVQGRRNNTGAYEDITGEDIVE